MREESGFLLFLCLFFLVLLFVGFLGFIIATETFGDTGKHSLTVQRVDGGIHHVLNSADALGLASLGQLVLEIEGGQSDKGDNQTPEGGSATEMEPASVVGSA